MKYLLISLILLANYPTISQNSRVIVYAEEGEEFTLAINGKVYNDEPQSRVEAKGLDMDFAQISIRFTTAGAPLVKSGQMIDSSTSYTLVVKKNKKGKYVLRMVSWEAYEEEVEPIEKVKISQAVAPSPTTTNAPSQSNGTTTVTTTTTTSSSGANGGDSENIGISLNVGGESLNMNIGIGGVNGEVTETTSITTTSTSTYQTTEVSNQEIQAAPQPTTPPCAQMSPSSFSRAQTSINGKAFEDEKMTVFKQVIKNNCVSVDQVIGFMSSFTYEEEKLQVAKLAYPKTTNKGDYYQVNDAFTFSDSVEQLNAFLERQ